MIIHVDMSGKFYKKENVGIAWTDDKKQKHKGLFLSGRQVARIIETKNADYDFSRLYAICIYLIVKEDIVNIKELILCTDETFIEVKEYLILLLAKEGKNDKSIKSIGQYREEKKKEGKGGKIISCADGFANSYRKRGPRECRWDKGRELNIIKAPYEEIINLWNLIDLELKKSR